MSDFTLNFSATGADGSTSFSNGTDTIGVTVSTPTNNSRDFYLDGNTLRSSGVTEPVLALVTFDTAVTGVTFEIYDVDAGSGWDDRVTVIALDADGNQVPITFTNTTVHHIVTGNTVEADGNASPGVEGSGASDTVRVTIPGSVVCIQVIHDNGGDYHRGGVVHVGPIDFDAVAAAPCFTPGTMILTPTGERAVEDLCVGDLVVTRDNGVQKICWVGGKPLDWKTLGNNPHLRPVMIRAGSLGAGMPDRDLLLSPNHRLLVSNEVTSLYFDEHEILAAAKHLVNRKSVHKQDVMSVTYIHFMFENHEIVLANGCWTESFQPGDYSLKGVGNMQRREIYEIFPELKSPEGIQNYTSARKVLKRHEASLIVPS
ncbi:Hint domain-containing protein [Halocynthiibacter namhaensis]|uniref:Hint domain-containing protein n=1 Tax=Halocynthiibacter namhaensis TaxID=1290553 RepID=UPI00068F91CF|nr:Hint domain-containing protein [Halocynthiibacter namhaensis]